VDRQRRLGHGGVERGYHDLMTHPFFKRNGVKWDDLYAVDGPFVPSIEGDMDVGYFDKMQLSDFVPSDDEDEVEDEDSWDDEEGAATGDWARKQHQKRRQAKHGTPPGGSQRRQRSLAPSLGSSGDVDELMLEGLDDDFVVQDQSALRHHKDKDRRASQDRSSSHSSDRITDGGH